MENLIKRDFRGFLLENIIKYVDQVAKDYCEIVFGTRELKIYLDGNALDISYCNKMFDNLSGGEKQRVDLILQFAIRNMLNAYLNTSSNILVLDEITDFLDKQSCKAVMTLIEKELTTIESVFVVSHHAAELELPIDSEIKVVKSEFGISEVI
jgi:DNA repair exonuclease SbcCD ATPase subunit